MAQNKMLIDASHPEETRVVVVRGSRVEEFDFESENKSQIRGNIYLAKVTRVEPSLQAAFVDYGGNRHGFLAFSEIHPDYYQIPMADRQALLDEEAAVAKEEAEEEKQKEQVAKPAKRRRRSRRKPASKKAQDESADKSLDASIEESASAEESANTVADDKDETDSKVEADTKTEEESAGPSNEDTSEAPKSIGAENESDTVSEPAGEEADDVDDVDDNEDDESDDGDSDDGDDGDDGIESVGVEDALEEVPVRRVKQRQYKIQEVIKRRQIILVQVVKEERGNKGAALTTYLSLAGRYSVLMPNTARGGGISRKITNLSDRKRLKSIASELDVAEGMGVILRTAGASRTKPEIRRDFEYLLRLWENVRNLTLQSTAPCLVYEEGSLIKRSIRDLYDKDTGDIYVSGEDAFNEAKSFMSMLMPSHAKYVKRYTDRLPIFSRNGVEAQLDKMLQPQVTLKSGGYLVINQTEALVAIDVNSGRSTRQHSIEDTATQTNLEAAEEVARQLRLRDLAGLIVVDFIDMEEKRNNRAVEKRLKDALKNDRARIQVSRISHFGLLEMSRQRIRASVLESTTQVCPSCEGMGHVRSPSSVALHVLRTTEEYLLKASRHNLVVKTSAETAQYVLNYKRLHLVDLETRFGVLITIEIDHTIGSQFLSIERGEFATPRAQAETHVQPDSFWPDEGASTVDDNQDAEEVIESDDTDDRPKRKRRRSRRGRGRSSQGNETSNEETSDATSSDDAVPAENAAQPEEDGDTKPKRRRRGRRGGRSNNATENVTSEETEASGNGKSVEADNNGAGTNDVAADIVAKTDAPEKPEVAAEVVDEKPSRNRRPGRQRKAKVVATSETVETPAVTEAVADAAISKTAQSEPTSEVKAEEAPKAPRRTSRRPRKKKVEDIVEKVEAFFDEVKAEITPEKAPTKEKGEQTEDQAPAKPRRTTRRKASAKAVEKPDVVVEDTSVATEDKAPAKPRRTTRKKASPKAVEKPAVVVEEPAAVDDTPTESAESDKKSKKGGWWQRRSFF